MHYNQTQFFERDSARLKIVIPAEEMLLLSHACAESPFKRHEKVKIFIRNFKRALIRVVQLLTGHTLLVEDYLGPLKKFSPETLGLLRWLTKHNYIKKWSCNDLTPGQPSIAKLNLSPSAIKGPQGQNFNLVGATGNGSGQTLQKAALPALGEFIERYSVSSDWWKRTDVITTSVAELESRNVAFLDPAALRFWDSANDGPFAERSRVTADTRLQWVAGEDFITRRPLRIPAASAYTFFNSAHPDEPILGETSSNGAAAYSNLAEAEYRAVCELIERDAVVRAWYQKVGVVELSLVSIKDTLPEYREIISSIEKNAKMRLKILDITTDIQVPTFCIVYCNHEPGSHAVAISAATDIDPYVALKKVVWEVVKFLHGKVPHVSEATKQKLLIEFNKGNIDSFNQRYQFWSMQESIAHVEWFLDHNTEATCVDVCDRYTSLMSSENNRAQVQQRLCEKNISVGIVRFKNKLTERSGLEVVRAISPDLVPIFFTEANRPMNYKRFTTTPDGAKANLQTIPHPFI